ncbi:MAG: hypothetical protein ACR2F1_03755 [Nitrososphaeraceae archaeon]
MIVTEILLLVGESKEQIKVKDNLYVFDNQNNRFQVFSSDGKYIKSIEKKDIKTHKYVDDIHNAHPNEIRIDWLDS